MSEVRRTRRTEMSNEMHNAPGTSNNAQGGRKGWRDGKPEVWCRKLNRQEQKAPPMCTGNSVFTEDSSAKGAVRWPSQVLRSNVDEMLAESSCSEVWGGESWEHFWCFVTIPHPGFTLTFIRYQTSFEWKCEFPPSPVHTSQLGWWKFHIQQDK